MKVEDAADARWLKERRKKPMSFRSLEECFSAAEIRKIAHNLHAKAKREIASERARKFRRPSL
jgi:hypothetical protein